MTLAPFFDRVYGAVGGHLSVSREALEQRLGQVVVGVECVDAEEPNVAWIAELAVNILSRLYPCIAITGNSRLAGELKQLARRINPALEFADVAPQEHTIAIGRSSAPHAVRASAQGWVARLGAEGLHEGPPNPYSAGAAAALACAALFRRVFLGTGKEPEFALSLLTFDDHTGHDESLTDRDLGEVWYVGVGAVGNAGLWALGRDHALVGRVWLIDPETLTLPNLQRYVLGVLDDVGRHKTEIGRDALAQSRLKIDVVSKSLEEFADSADGGTPPTIAVSVDNVDSRRTAQALLPRVVVNGWTGDRALGSSWHVFARDVACLACLYHPHGQGLSATEQAAHALGLAPERAAALWVTRMPLTASDLQAAAAALGVPAEKLSPWQGRTLGELYTDAVCGAVPLDVTGIGRVESVPLAHQSVLAGVLMAAELVKRTTRALATRSQPEPLVSYDDVLRAPPSSYWARPRAREAGCICGDVDYQAVYASRWGSITSAE